MTTVSVVSIPACHTAETSFRSRGITFTCTFRPRDGNLEAMLHATPREGMRVFSCTCRLGYVDRGLQTHETLRLDDQTEWSLAIPEWHIMGELVVLDQQARDNGTFPVVVEVSDVDVGMDTVDVLLQILGECPLPAPPAASRPVEVLTQELDRLQRKCDALQVELDSTRKRARPDPIELLERACEACSQITSDPESLLRAEHALSGALIRVRSHA